jgi:hypothetical protein
MILYSSAIPPLGVTKGPLSFVELSKIVIYEVKLLRR